MQDTIKRRMMRSFSPILCLLFILSIFPACAVAAPLITGVSGAISNGNQIVITGSSFGIKPKASPLISSYDNPISSNNWSNGTIGSNWHVNGSVELSNYSPRAASYQSSRKLVYDADGSYANIGYDRNAGDDKLYVSWWMYRDYNEWLGNPSGGGNSKFFRVYTNSAAGDSVVLSLWWNGSQLQYAYGQAEYAPSCPDWQIAYTTTSATKSASAYWRVTFGNGDPVLQKWEHYEVFISYPTSPGGTDASITLLKDGQTIWRCTGIAIDTSNSLDNWRWVRIGQVSGDRTGSRTEYIDQVYIDNTFAHVFLSDSPNASWPDSASVRHDEIQVCSSWSDSSITFTLNQGSFSNGQTVYLYVVTPDGEINNPGYPIVIGGGSSGDNPPATTITSPVNQDTYQTSNDAVSLAGTASDDNGISSVTWANSRGGSGAANNDSGDWTSWSVADIPLQEGENVITVTATDTAGQTATDTLTVTYNASDTVQVWSANQQTGDQDWDDSGATWCARVLIEGDSITQSGSQIMLGFQGRSSGDYRIRKVSIAERDPNGNDGDVIDSTWTKVTFDGKDESTWDTDVAIVPAGSMKLSNPVSFNIQPGKDYYVTYLLESPSVYLIAPSYYQELYFEGSDHSEDVDWSSNGHSTYQARLHALGAIYVTGSDTTPPGDVTNASISQGVGSLTLSWTNPTDSDFAGVMIRYRTDGTYPQSATDGQPIPNGNNGRITGTPGETMSYTHNNLDPTLHYYYAIYTYDTSGNYSHTVFLDAQPLPPDSGNQPPTASITASPTSGESPLTVTFSGSGSDSDGTIVSYSWNFGDGSTSSSQNPTHTYARVSSDTQYTVTLTVTDNDGATGQATTTITVNPDATPPAPPSGITVN